MSSARTVLVVGAGISGLACAGALLAAGIPTRIVERGRVAGGRMASRRLEGRPVDLGAAFFTAAPGTPFESVVQGWLDRGLARPWTETFAVADPGVALTAKTGPVRYAAPNGLRALAAELGEGMGIQFEHGVVSVSPGSASGTPTGGEASSGATADGEEFAAVVLAMPDPQARRLVAADSTLAATLDDGSGWAPTIAVVLGWDDASWSRELHGVFVNGSPALTFVADDGDRRGDGAPVLVAHSTAELAREHLDDPDASIAPITEAVRTLLHLDDAPSWSYAHRWTFARTVAGHPDPFLLDGAIGVCGDGWGGTSSVGGAWRSGDALGRELAGRLSA
ncbi:MAG: NAD(P)-binding protein [Acidobacteria bacterium]|nr:NAD(P)-binding protein [Acidobacteriota bacterium]